MSQTDQDKATAAHGKIIARAWRDPAFKAKFVANPHAMLKEAGVAVPEGVTVKVVENTDTHHHLVLPPKPTGELSDAKLDKVAGGVLLLVEFRNRAISRRAAAIRYSGSDKEAWGVGHAKAGYLGELDPSGFLQPPALSPVLWIRA